ncbi:hypothetical protein RHMOL_Rhmol03G0263500 [Rhododendron molle]|uniref:Uncharacterized protein n=1 Tax=Rhododendron molle TaxID=49168 RepID=A0ACC0PL98_RHOML|nr:hypothetical protein RHMOL_Rhmol03G0263500 [Rhododendron molle]
MGSSYYGEPNYSGNERSAAAGGGGGGGSSSRKGNNKKGGSNNNSEKAPKLPQRGLGVAQLEKIRLNSQLIPSPTPSTNYHLPTHYPTHLLNQQEEIRMQTAASFPYAPAASSYGFHGHQNVADSFQKKRKKDSVGSSNQNSNTSDSELDLELRL